MNETRKEKAALVRDMNYEGKPREPETVTIQVGEISEWKCFFDNMLKPT